MVSREWQVIIAGEGGQGQLFIAMLLGETAIKEGNNAAQTASYGIASRGGFTKAEVVISSSEILYPAVTKPNVILALSAEAVEKYLSELTPDCLLIYDLDIYRENIEQKNVRGLPLTTTAKKLAEETGKKAMVNIIGLGAIIGLTKIVTWEAIEKVLKEEFSPEQSNLNLNALQYGIACCNN